MWRDIVCISYMMCICCVCKNIYIYIYIYTHIHTLHTSWPQRSRSSRTSLRPSASSGTPRWRGYDCAEYTTNDNNSTSSSTSSNADP